MSAQGNKYKLSQGFANPNSSRTAIQKGDTGMDIINQKKETLAKEYSKTDVKFQKSAGEKVEEEFKSYTVGLSTREEFKRKHENIISLIQEKQEHEMEAQELKQKQMVQNRKQKYKQQQQALSFLDDEEDEENEDEEEEEDITQKKEEKEEEEELNKKRKLEEIQPEKQERITNIHEINEEEVEEKLQKKILIGKNPNANTEFLPDMKRDQLNILKKEKLKLEYIQRKEKLENQFVQIQFSYWDGFKVVKTIRVKQKTTILGLLDSCRKQLIQEYPSLVKVKAVDLIAVARDHILSNKLSFYEIIESNLTNKKGQKVFNFEEKTEKDPLGKEITISHDDNTVIMIIERKVTEKAGENPLYFFLKDQ